MLLLEVLNVWDENEENVEWEEMAQVGVRILLAFISRPETEYCATASSKLSKLLKVRINTSQGELCYTLGLLHQAFVVSREKGIKLHYYTVKYYVLREGVRTGYFSLLFLHTPHFTIYSVRKYTF